MLEGNRLSAVGATAAVWLDCVAITGPKSMVKIKARIMLVNKALDFIILPLNHQLLEIVCFEKRRSI